MKLKNLPWLPAPADDFRARARELRGAADPDASQVRRLATSALSLTQLEMLSKAAARVGGVNRLKVSVLSNATTDLLLSALGGTAPRHGIWLDVAGAPFGAFVSEALDPDSGTHQRGNDIVVLALDYRAFEFTPCVGEPDLAEDLVQAAFGTLTRLASAFQTAHGTLVIAQTLAPPVHSLFGSLDGQLPGTLRWMTDRFNQLLRAARCPGMVLFDVAHLAATVGLDEWHDPIQWNLGKFQFSHEVLPFYADGLCQTIMAAKGMAKKCLVLDLDNTLWGGIIGDDGMAGIALTQGDAVGEAFLAVQQVALALRDRGIILAVSSKNDHAVAIQVFREHPDMLLREEHIAVFQANWKDKASNLAAIADALCIDVSALVFLDDNPAERAQVRQALPEVGVPELPSSPEFFPTMLLAAGYFGAIQFTSEDSARAAQYQENAARRVMLESASDMGAYLASLDMQAHVAGFDALARARVTQLINKTNQFNLTTRRYTEACVENFENDPAVLGLQVRLKDRFGDNGIICIVICKREGEAWKLDTWLMSCRVLNRSVEDQVLNVLLDLARARGVQQLIGQYRASGKNGMVRDHYRRLGFTPVSESPDEATWILEVASATPRSVPIVVTLGPGLGTAITISQSEAPIAREPLTSAA